MQFLKVFQHFSVNNDFLFALAFISNVVIKYKVRYVRMSNTYGTLQKGITL